LTTTLGTSSALAALAVPTLKAPSRQPAIIPITTLFRMTILLNGESF
jgi:hypothetical protein